MNSLAPSFKHTFLFDLAPKESQPPVYCFTDGRSALGGLIQGSEFQPGRFNINISFRLSHELLAVH